MYQFVIGTSIGTVAIAITGPTKDNEKTPKISFLWAGFDYFQSGYIFNLLHQMKRPF